MSKSKVYESIMAGLNEALEDSASRKPILKRNEVTVEPVKKYGAASRILRMMEMDDELIAKYPFVSSAVAE